MGIQLVGEPEALKAFGVEAQEFAESFEKNLDGLTALPCTNVDFPTVSIPDVRLDTESTVQPSPSGNSSEFQPAETISNLERIRQAIEKSMDVADHDTSNQMEIHKLKAALARTNNKISASLDHEQVDPVSRPLNPKRLLPDSKCYLAKLESRDVEIEPIVNSIDELFPSAGHNILSFAGSEQNEQLGTVVARAATMLHRRTQKNVLIIDCDFESQQLTELLHADVTPGLAGLATPGAKWEDLVAPTSFPKIDVVSLGKISVLNDSKISQLVKRTLVAIKHYNYVLVNVGNAHGEMSENWAKHVNGTYLLVSLDKTNQEMAKSAVAQLNSCGARLLGCVVSEHPKD